MARVIGDLPMWWLRGHQESNPSVKSECALGIGVDDDALADGLQFTHFFSAFLLNAASASLQNWSKNRRRFLNPSMSMA